MASGDRQAAIAQRTLLIERLRAMPAAMRERPQWLLWRYEQREGKPKPLKVPYYASGKVRGGVQGSEADRAALVALDVVLQRLGGGLHWSGAGFAFLPGDGLIGIDVDGAVDPDDGSMSDLCRTVVQVADSYTELSPSGRGVHVIVAGHVDKSFKSNEIGLEVFCGSQFFTCTGAHLADTPREVQAIEPDALAYLQERVDKAKAAAKAEPAPDPEAAAAAPPPAPPSPPPRPGQGGDDFRRVNDAALQHLAAWVPAMLPAARVFQGGYRITSKALGRELEEDLQLLPAGIMDFGTEQGMSPIDCVMQWGHQRTAKDALHWLAGQLGLPLTKPQRPKLSVVPPAGGDAREGRARKPPPPPTDDERPQRRVKPGPAGGAPGAPAEGEGGGLERLLQHYCLIRGTDMVWDGETRRQMKVANLRLVFGNDAVKMWLRSPDRRMVLPEHMVFEPGVEVPPDHINLFDGFAMEPVPCTAGEVAPMLELLYHLCSRSAATDTGVEEVVSWVLKWLALPLQKPGAKMRTALVFHGPQGTGKNLFFDGVRSMYGKYGRMVGQTELEDKFNDWLSAKLMIIGNEVVTRAELFHHKNKLKWIVTEDEIPIRGMQQSVRWESNHANVLFLSNEGLPLALERDDRRHGVVYTPAARDDDLYVRVARFLEAGGAAKFMHYLQQLELGDFNEFSKPVMTVAKQSLIDLSLKPAERFVTEWLSGLLDLPVGVCSSEQLYRVFRRWCDKTGERFPPAQAVFTSTVNRHVDETIERDAATGERLEPALVYKMFQLKHAESAPRKSQRCWMPRDRAGPQGEQSEGEWAADCIDAFEKYVAAFGRTHAEVPE